MSTSEGDGDREERQQGRLAAPLDLIDFYQRWPDFRLAAVCAAECPNLSAMERQTISWLIQLADRIGDHDLKPATRS